MRTNIIKGLLVTAGFTLLGLQAPLVAHAASGVTITPATLTLNLAKGDQERSAQFALTNNYDVPVALHFAVEKSSSANANQEQPTDPAALLSIQTPDVTLAPGQTFQQTLTLHDTTALTPGSQLADLVISQPAVTTGRRVAVAAAIRMPLILVKEDGAVASLALTGWRVPHFTISLPSHASVFLRNSGNVIVIPHGVIALGRGGQQLAQGTLNSGSAALAPGQTTTFAVPLTKLGHSWLPGIYTMRLSYGLGSDSAVRTVSARFVYIAWWQAVVLIGATCGLYYAVRYVLRRQAHPKHNARPPAPKRPLLIGRDIT